MKFPDTGAKILSERFKWLVHYFTGFTERSHLGTSINNIDHSIARVKRPSLLFTYFRNPDLRSSDFRLNRREAIVAKFVLSPTRLSFQTSLPSSFTSRSPSSSSSSWFLSSLCVVHHMIHSKKSLYDLYSFCIH